MSYQKLYFSLHFFPGSSLNASNTLRCINSGATINAERICNPNPLKVRLENGSIISYINNTSTVNSDYTQSQRLANVFTTPRLGGKKTEFIDATKKTNLTPNNGLRIGIRKIIG